MVGRFAPVRRKDRQDEPLKERPLLIRPQVSCQTGLLRRFQLGLRLTRSVNPFCQHDLMQKKFEIKRTKSIFGQLEILLGEGQVQFSRRSRRKQRDKIAEDRIVINEQENKSFDC